MSVLPMRRSSTRLLLSLAAVVAMLATVLAAPGRAQAPGGECAAPMPVDELTVGMAASGLTVSSGNTPEPFDAEILGVLDSGIAPGIDMIIADLDSPAVQRAGVWAGMSGSPVYADDGRLIGAVAYSFSWEQSSIAGITPAEQMVKLYNRAGATSSAGFARDVPLSAALSRRVLAASDTSRAAVADGLSRLPTPVSVSGLQGNRLDRVQRRIDERLGNAADLRLFAGARAPAAPGDPGEIFAGSNFAAALSYGDISWAGIGTTTDVCDGRALAFGHPFTFEGRTAFSAHTADAITIVPDGGFSFKLANPGGVVGTVDQDRLAGIRGVFDDGPVPSVVASTMSSRTTGEQRTGETFVNIDEWVPDIAGTHLFVNLDTTLDKIGEGRVAMSWTASGTHTDGQPWRVTRTNRFASQSDVSWPAAIEMWDFLYAIGFNRYTDVAWDDITMSATVDETFSRLHLGTVRVRVNDGRWRRINRIDRLRVRAGDTISARVPLRRYDEEEPFRRVRLDMRVPRRFRGQSMRLGVLGGANVGNEVAPWAGTDFDDVLRRIRRADRNSDVIMRLQQRGDDGDIEVRRRVRERLRNVVRGRRFVRVRVRG